MDIDTITTEKADAVNLRELFPLARRSVFRRAFVWLLVYVLAVIGVLVAGFRVEGTPGTGANATQFFANIFFYVFFWGLAICALKLLYEEYYYFRYYYGIAGGHLIVSKGIVLKERGSFPLSLITDVYLERDPADFVFALYNIAISTANPESFHFARIEGLSMKSAVELQDQITKFVEAAHPEVTIGPEVSNHDEAPNEKKLAEQVEEVKKAKGPGGKETAPGVDLAEEIPAQKEEELSAKEELQSSDAGDKSNGTHAGQARERYSDDEEAVEDPPPQTSSGPDDTDNVEEPTETEDVEYDEEDYESLDEDDALEQSLVDERAASNNLKS